MTDTDTKLAPAPAAGAVVAFDYSQIEGGTGFENASTKDLTTPYILVLQDLSKPTKEHESAYIPGAKPGMFLNTGTRELIAGARGFGFVPLHIDHCVVEWDADRRFIARHPVDAPIFKEALERFEANGNSEKSLAKDVRTADGKHNLVETYYLWSLLLDEDGETPIAGAIIPFKSSNIKKYRKEIYTPLYSSKLGGGRLFVHRVRCVLVLEKAPKGASFNYSFAPLRGTIKDSLIDPSSQLMATVLQVRKDIAEGRAKQAEDSATRVAEGERGDSGGDEVFS